jgi:predicted nucleic acid-binding protein
VIIRDALSGVSRLYIEAAPLIYYVEANPVYVDRMEEVISLIEDIPVRAVSSVITLTEVLNQPVRLGRVDLEQQYKAILFSSPMFQLFPVSLTIADSAARLRARYNLRTPDALHIATAISAGCQAFLTNDNTLKRVTELSILILDDLEIN